MKLFQVIIILSLCSYSFGFLNYILDLFGFSDYDDDDDDEIKPKVEKHRPRPIYYPAQTFQTTTITTPEPAGPDVSR